MKTEFIGGRERHRQSVWEARKGREQENLLCSGSGGFSWRTVVWHACPLRHPGSGQNKDEGSGVSPWSQAALAWRCLEPSGLECAHDGFIVTWSFLRCCLFQRSHSLRAPGGEDICCLHYEVQRAVGVQVLARTEAGEGAKCRFPWSPSVSHLRCFTRRIRSRETAL